jgi:MFS family permease
VHRTPWDRRVAGFLGAEALSSVGSFATVVAVWGYATFRLDATPGELSLYGLAFSAPGVLLGPAAGSVVDRVGAKETLAASKVLGIVGSLLLLTVDTFLAMAALTVLHGVAFAFAEPALQSMPPRLVDDAHLATTNSLVGMTDECSLVFGPVVAGAAIAVFGFHGAFVVDAITYAIGLVVLPLVHLRPKATAAGGSTMRPRDVFAGWSLVVRVRALRWTVVCTAAVFSLYGLAMVAEPLYVRDVLGRSPSTFAALQGVFGLFLLAGGVLAARLGERIASLRWVSFGVIGSAAAALLYLATPWVVVAFIGVAVWGLFTAAISGPSRTVLQRGSPEHAHGRVLAVDLVAGNGAMFVGTVMAGPLIDVLHVRGTVVVVGLLAGAAGVAVSGRGQETLGGDEVEGQRLVADVVEEHDDAVALVAQDEPLAPGGMPDP